MKTIRQSSQTHFWASSLLMLLVLSVVVRSFADPPFAVQTGLGSTNIYLGEPVEIWGVFSNATSVTQLVYDFGGWSLSSGRVTEFQEGPRGKEPVVPNLHSESSTGNSLPKKVTASKVVGMLKAGEVLSTRIELLLVQRATANAQLGLRFPSNGLYAVRLEPIYPKSFWRAVGPTVHFLQVNPVPPGEERAWEFYRQPEILRFLQSPTAYYGRTPDLLQNKVGPLARKMKAEFPNSMYTQIFATKFDKIVAAREKWEEIIGLKPQPHVPGPMELVRQELESMHYDVDATVEANHDAYMNEVLTPYILEEDQRALKNLPTADSYRAKLLKAFVLKHGKKLEGQEWEDYLKRKQEKNPASSKNPWSSLDN